MTDPRTPAFWKKLGNMLRAGVPLGETLETLEAENRGSALGATLADVAKGVKAGAGFFEALARHPEVLGEDVVALGKGGEASAKVAGALARLGAALDPATIDLLADLKDAAEAAPKTVADDLGGLLCEALAIGASDVHVEAERDGGRVRFRVGGALEKPRTIGRAELDGLVAELRELARFDAGDEAPFAHSRHEIEVREGALEARVRVRLTLSPGHFGPHAHLGIETRTDRGAELPRAEDVFPDPAIRRRVAELVGRKHGLFVVTGPTGSGKTTVVVALLAGVDREARRVVSIEDPVVVPIPGVHQLQVQPAKGLTHLAALRGVAWMDADVVALDEVRDPETAAMAARLALVGHQVIVPLHAPTAAGALVRLVEIGLEPFMVGDAVSGVLAVRLLRRLCPACKTADPGTRARLGGLAPGLDASGAAAPGGCPACRGTGYRGVVPVQELLEPTPAVQAALRGAHPAAGIEAAAAAAGHVPLAAAALAAVARGDTSLAEAVSQGLAGGVSAGPAS